MGRYRTLNVDLNRNYRNDLNQNFTDIERDIVKNETEIKTVKSETLGKIDEIVGGGFIESLESARDLANTAATDANTQATYAKNQGDHATTQGDYAKNQGDYALAKGDYANEKALLADAAASNANVETGNLSQLKIDVVDATQSANLAATTANNEASNANAQAAYAKQQGDYAGAQGNYAKLEGDKASLEASNLSDLKTALENATTNAIDAASLAENEASNLATLKLEAETATADATTATNNAETQASHAKSQGDYAKVQGDYAKQQADLIQDILDDGSVASVNGQTGAVTLDANDVGAYTKSETDNKIAGIVDSAPETLNTLNELATALGNDPNFATTISNQIGNKIDQSEKGIANGVALLNADGKVIDAQGNEVEGKVTSVNDQIGDVSIDIPDISGKADKTEVAEVSSKMGILSNLETTNKDNLVEAINEVNSKEVDVSQLAKKVDFDNHVVDEDVHVSQVEKDLWNNKSEFDGDYNSLSNLPNLTQYATVSQLNAKTPVLKGKSNFNSTTGKIISHSIGHTNYYVDVTPSQNPNGYLGEVWVEYSSTSFKVCCSGTATTEFRYVVYV